MSPLRKPPPLAPLSVVVARRDTDDPTKRRELVQLLAKLVAKRRHSGRDSE